jgi:hypothetical protein
MPKVQQTPKKQPAAPPEKMQDHSERAELLRRRSHQQASTEKDSWTARASPLERDPDDFVGSKSRNNAL